MRWYHEAVTHIALMRGKKPDTDMNIWPHIGHWYCYKNNTSGLKRGGLWKQLREKE